MVANKKRPGKIQSVFLILTIALMVTIFLLSAQDADTSSNTSGTLTRIFVKLFFRDYDSSSLEKQAELWNRASFIVRKLAHFSIYTALGFCASFTAGKRKLLSPKSLAVVLFGFLYALSDEVHQQFVKGRSCEFRDMMIDTGGIITGMLISFVSACLIALVLKRHNDK
ncbi:MAG: VanZ family protein [Ruminococcus sp.]|uniref:VanZ family protein n=1 Tax=Ruminococcus sp. TaxID=41978 RepID=UPI001B213133|nr:VanZ family protein [Ruminococcus sp.]MBO7475253.1 VanZ family protein [Ruminococcus sp.]